MWVAIKSKTINLGNQNKREEKKYFVAWRWRSRHLGLIISSIKRSEYTRNSSKHYVFISSNLVFIAFLARHNSRNHSQFQLANRRESLTETVDLKQLKTFRRHLNQGQSDFFVFIAAESERLLCDSVFMAWISCSVSLFGYFLLVYALPLRWHFSIHYHSAES